MEPDYDDDSDPDVNLKSPDQSRDVPLPYNIPVDVHTASQDKEYNYREAVIYAEIDRSKKHKTRQFLSPNARLGERVAFVDETRHEVHSYTKHGSPPPQRNQTASKPQENILERKDSKSKHSKKWVSSKKRLKEKQKSWNKSTQAHDNPAMYGEGQGYPRIVIEDVDEILEDMDNIYENKSKDGSVHNGDIRVRHLSSSSQLSDTSIQSYGKEDSPGLLSLSVFDFEDDPEFRDSLMSLVRERRRGSGRGSRRHKKLRRHSLISTHSEVRGQTRDEQTQEEQELLQLYSDQTPDEEQLLENIKLQQDIISGVRTQPWPMKHKLKTLRLAKSYVEKYEGRLSRRHGYQEKGTKFWLRFKRELINFASIFIPWEMRIKKIESHFGSVVSSYFVFLRWLFWVNILLTLILLGFIALPQLLFGAKFGSSRSKTIPEGEMQNALSFNTLFNFEGYLEYSVLFYGYYDSDEIIGGVYRLPLGYFLAGLGTYAISFMIILRRMAANSRLSKLSTKDEQYTFNWKVFTTWDYMIGNLETAKNKSAEIATSFRESILEEQEKKKQPNRRLLVALRILANFLVVIVLTSSTYAIYLVVERSKEVEERLERGDDVSWWDQNEVSIVTSLITTLYPSLFDLIGLMEKYHPRTNLRWQLARILVLYLLNLYTLVVALINKIHYKQDIVNQQKASQNATVMCDAVVPSVIPIHGYVYLNTTYETNCTLAVPDSSKLNCWETMLGQEFFKLTVFDLIITVLTTIAVDYIRGLFVRYMNRCWCWDLERKFPEYGEFKIAENILHLIYNQAMIWMGTFFAPMLPCLNIFKLLAMLYLRSWAVMMCNIPHERVFRASRSNNFYFAITLMMLFLASLAVMYLLVTIQPSTECGPLSGFVRSYDVVIDFMDKNFPSWLNTALGYVASPGVVIPFFLLLAMVIYYLLSLTRSLKEANADLKLQLEYERTEEKRKIYAMADAKHDNNQHSSNPADGSTENNTIMPPGGQNTQSTEEGTRHSSLRQRGPGGQLQVKPGAGGQQQVKPGAGGQQQVKPGAQVIRVPGMTLQQAMALQSKNPGLKIITADQAKRLKLVPTHQMAASTLTGGSTVPRPGPVAPPVAVVQGKPMDLQRNRSQLNEVKIHIND